MLLSFAMMLRYSFDLGDDADRVEQAVQNVLNEGYRTGDIMQDGCNLVSTEEMGTHLLAELDRLAD
jgi:3-isopropylmalate dehydrogenase